MNAPRLGEQVRDVERLAVQAKRIIDLVPHPASLPVDPAESHTAEMLRLSVGFHFDAALRELARLAALRLPPAGSAVPVPLTRPAGSPGEEPPPGSATAVAAAVRESPGVLPTPGAGDNVRAVRPTSGPRFLPGPGEATQRIGRHSADRLPPPPRWPLADR